MAKDPENWSVDANTVDPVKTLQDRAALVEWLYAQANAAAGGSLVAFRGRTGTQRIEALGEWSPYFA